MRHLTAGPFCQASPLPPTSTHGWKLVRQRVCNRTWYLSASSANASISKMPTHNIKILKKSKKSIVITNTGGKMQEHHLMRKQCTMHGGHLDKYCTAMYCSIQTRNATTASLHPTRDPAPAPRRSPRHNAFTECKTT